MSIWQVRRRYVLLLLIVCISIAVVYGLILLAPIGLANKAPSEQVVERFDRSSITQTALTVQTNLQAQLQDLSFASNGFTLAGSTYADGCYAAHRDSGFMIDYWYKACYGRAMLYVASHDPTPTADSKLLALLAASHWHPLTSSHSTTDTCFGWPNNFTSNADLNYQVSGVSASCPDPLPQAEGDTVVAYALSQVHYTALTHTLNEATLLDQLRAQGFASVARLSIEREYFHEKLP